MNDDEDPLPIMTKAEMEAKQRFYWSKIRQAMKLGQADAAAYWLEDIKCNENTEIHTNLSERLADTFKAGCNALGDPAPLTKENDHE
jgi:hypothetical protein